MKYALLFFASFLLTTLSGQSPEEIDKDLSDTYAKVDRFSSNNPDSLSFYSSLFEKKIAASLVKDPSTLGYSFKLLARNSSCRVTTSGDGLLRIYSWDSQEGGTMHFFKNIFQFKSGDKVSTKRFNLRETDPDGFYSTVFTLKTTTATYYLALRNGIYSSKEMGQSIKVFTIINHQLTDTVKLIKTRSSRISHIDISFDASGDTEIPGGAFPAIEYDADKKIIYVPIILKDGKITNRFIFYQFNGQYFEYTKTGNKE